LALHLLGFVSTDPHPQSPYIRVSCPPDNLSMKAMIGVGTGFFRDNIRKGDVVQVEETAGGYKGWNIIGHWKKLGKRRTVYRSSEKNEQVFVRQPDDSEPDRVRFIVPERNIALSNGPDSHTFRQLLNECFGISGHEINGRQGTVDRYGQRGLAIICRPSQFARFLIKRHEAGLPNRFMDLKPMLFEVNPAKDPIDVSDRPYKQEC